MTVEDWSKPLLPKYNGTHGLVDAFNVIPLDFFVMLLSGANIAGTRAQVNYNAGIRTRTLYLILQAWSKTHYTTLNMGLVTELGRAPSMTRLHAGHP